MYSAEKIVKLIEAFFTEMDGSKIKPNALTIQTRYYERLKQMFPYLIKNNKYLRGRDALDIILTKDDVISVGFCYYYKDESLSSYFTDDTNHESTSPK